jgi:DNA-binding GntR family transcriptional regulator
MFMREALEVEAVRLIATPRPAIAGSHRQISSSGAGRRAGDVYRLYDLDTDFHSRLMLATDFRRVVHQHHRADCMDRPRQFAA